MYSVDGFFHLWPNPYETEDESARLAWVIESIPDWLREYRLDGERAVHLIPTNGQVRLIVSRLWNHAGSNREDVHAFLSRVAREAPGSYGLLYEIDQDLPPPEGLTFSVLVMKRGRVERHPDPYFSPIWPVVEDRD